MNNHYYNYMNNEWYHWNFQKFPVSLDYNIECKYAYFSLYISQVIFLYNVLVITHHQLGRHLWMFLFGFEILFYCVIISNRWYILLRRKNEKKIPKNETKKNKETTISTTSQTDLTSKQLNAKKFQNKWKPVTLASVFKSFWDVVFKFYY